MIDPDLVDANALAQEGFKMIAKSGVLDAQLERLKERLSFGNADEPDESVVKTVKEFRRQYGIIESLRALGEGYYRENDRES